MFTIKKRKCLLLFTVCVSTHYIEISTILAEVLKKVKTKHSYIIHFFSVQILLYNCTSIFTIPKLFAILSFSSNYVRTKYKYIQQNIILIIVIWNFFQNMYVSWQSTNTRIDNKEKCIVCSIIIPQLLNINIIHKYYYII